MGGGGGGNALQFQEPPPPSAVAKAMKGLVDRPRREANPRFSDSLLVRFGTLCPNHLPRLMTLFRKKGERGLATYVRRLETEGHVVRTADGRELAETDRVIRHPGGK
ncbi:hypothetical protein [Tessaracoccus antarcticus]|uniref:hypothetical protein n=1 Tax=Tessaracoccus antarcticus TaxID=2479848 RepID=UPI001F45A723|nr:hypothetical protein [Tessaracoccus antarcticus]